MPHLIKEYSKNFGLEPGNPIVNRHFYPVIPDNYIVLYNEQDIQAKAYSHYNIVFDLLKNTLESAGISLVVIGSQKNLKFKPDYDYCGLGFRNNCYIISKAKAFISGKIFKLFLELINLEKSSKKLIISSLNGLRVPFKSDFFPTRYSIFELFII